MHLPVKCLKFCEEMFLNLSFRIYGYTNMYSKYICPIVRTVHKWQFILKLHDIGPYPRQAPGNDFLTGSADKKKVLTSKQGCCLLADKQGQIKGPHIKITFLKGEVQ